MRQPIILFNLAVLLAVVCQMPFAAAQTPAADCSQAATHWKSADQIKSLEVYQDHLARFPNCAFAGLARLRIEALAGKPPAPASVPAPAPAPQKAEAGASEPVSIMKASVAHLKVEAAKLGAPRIDGTEQVDGKDVPSLYLGQTKINNNVAAVADLAARAGGRKIIVYARSGDKFIIVATDIARDGRPPLVGQTLFIGDKPEAALRAGETIYGGSWWSPDDSRARMMAGREPIKNEQGAVIGAYELVLSPIQYCEATRALFPRGSLRPLLSVDGQPAAERRGTSELVDCETVAFSWYDGCNRNDGGFSISGSGNVKPAGGGASTLMACGDPAVEKITRAMNIALINLSHWRVDGDGALVLEGNGHEMIFGPEKVEAIATVPSKAATTEIRVPTLGVPATRATINHWFRKAGEVVQLDEPLVELDTDMATIEVPSPAAGVLSEVTARDGDTVVIGQLLGRIAERAPRPR